MPLPNTRVIPATWSTHHRSTAAGQMLSECVIRRPAGAAVTFNEASGAAVAATPATIYTGPCRAQRTPLAPSGSERAVADREVVVREWQVSLLTTAPQIFADDLVEITACADDPQLVGLTLRVRDIRSGTLLWQRDLMCEDIAPTAR